MKTAEELYDKPPYGYIYRTNKEGGLDTTHTRESMINFAEAYAKAHAIEFAPFVVHEYDMGANVRTEDIESIYTDWAAK